MFAQRNVIYSISNTLPMTKFEILVYGTAIFVIAYWFRIRWQYRKFYDLANKLPGHPSYPLKGSTFELPITPEKLMANIKKAAEDFNYEPVKMWIGPILFVGVFKPEDVQVVLNSSKAIEKGIVYQIIKNLAGEGVFTASVDKWRRHRRVIATIFNPKFLDQLFPIFNKNNKKLVENLSKHLDDAEPFDLWNYIMSCNLNNVSQAAMGFNNFDKYNISGFVHTLKKLTEFGQLLVKPWLYSKTIFAIFAHLSGWYNHKEIIDNITKEIIQEKQREYNSRKSEKYDEIDNNFKEKRTKVFLDKLLKLNDEGADFTDQDIRDEVITMTVAGSDTSAIGECFCLLLLAIHQDIQDKVYEEIYSIMGDSDRSVEPDEIPKFKYLEQVIKESLRHFSPGAIYSRKIDENIKLSNYELPAGCNVFVTPFVTHTIPKLYPNPREFNPENFSPENESMRNKFSYLAFSGGLRGCLGAKYAMLSMKLMLVEVLRNYRLYTKEKYSTIELQFDMLAKSKHGYKVTIQPRKLLKSQGTTV
ncbi:cytochrome P450 4C1-like [Daktulosphaira vitifoliae]|uniref:cytochrome P450 4C1-like n=1 Tax=Daktulosphaira vitifoliae TaxID=58002 RepID=UPI0021A9F9CE|nr:cytochrome P450 4C1-like [Daktulosphaira vitifoliae]